MLRDLPLGTLTKVLDDALDTTAAHADIRALLGGFAQEHGVSL